MKELHATNSNSLTQIFNMRDSSVWGSIGDNDDEATGPRRQETPQPLEDKTESEEDKDVEFNLPSSHGKEDGSALSNCPEIGRAHV